MVKKIKKTGKKKFFEASVPLISTAIHLYAHSVEELDGKVVKIDLTKNLKGKNVELRAKIMTEDGQLVGDLISLQLLQSYIMKVMRRGIDYIEDSFEAEAKDGKLRIKPFMLTRKKVSREIRKMIRETGKKYLLGKVKSMTKKEIFSEIMTNKFQKELSLKVKKIYPLALCEIRMLEVIAPPVVLKERVREKKDTSEKEQEE